MNTTAIAIQQLTAQPQQGLNGVVNIASEEQGTPQEQSFDQVFKMLIKGQTQQANGEEALAQLLKKNGEENAQELAAQLLSQNPLIAMLLSSDTPSSESITAALTQLTQDGQQPISLNAQGESLLQAISTAATTVQATPQAIATDFVAIMQEQTPVQQTQSAAADSQVNEAMQNEARVLSDKFTGIRIINTTQKQEQQPQQIAEKADFEAIAQKIKLEAATQQQGTAQQEESEPKDAKSETPSSVKQAEGKSSVSNEQALQATFEKQLTGTQAVGTDEITAKPTASQEIIRQTVQGIKENIASGKEEFVMKLSPEGLGEITVKLVSENGHTTMQLTTQNQNVQRILGAELEALRQAVRPYNVEVREVNTANQSQLDMSSQNSSQQQYQSNASSFFFNQQQGKQHNQQGYLSYNHTAEIASEDNAIPQHITSSKAINLHI